MNAFPASLLKFISIQWQVERASINYSKRLLSFFLPHDNHLNLYTGKWGYAVELFLSRHSDDSILILESYGIKIVRNLQFSINRVGFFKWEVRPNSKWLQTSENPELRYHSCYQKKKYFVCVCMCVVDGMAIYRRSRSGEKYLFFRFTRPSYSDRCFGY
jgi:hypothetical protein